MADTALAVAGPVLDILKDGLALVPIPGLGLIPQALSKVLEGVKVVRKNSNSRKAFENEAKRLSALIQNISGNADKSVAANGGTQDRSSGEIAVRRVAYSPELQGGMKELLRSIADIGTRTDSLKGGRISSFVYALHNRDVLQEMTSDLTKAMTDFQLKAHAAVDKGVQEIELRLILKELKYADAGYRSVHDQKSGLMDGTREDLLSELVAWSKGEGTITEHVYALIGPAGLGKSAVAYRLCTLLDGSSSHNLPSDAPALGASFFFVRDGGSLASIRALFPTIARQLALSQPALLPILLQPINAFVRKGDDQLQSFAFESLLCKPLATADLTSQRPVVIVVDGLDECADDKLLCEALMQLIGLVDQVPWLRLFVASRPEVRIMGTLRSGADAKSVHLCALDDENILEAGEADVAKYLVETILKIPGYKVYLEKNRDPLNQLVDRAGALFIFARVAVNVLDSNAYRDRPEKGFRFILSSKAAGPNELDLLYLQILRSAFPKADPKASPSDHADLRSLLTLICCGDWSFSAESILILHSKLAQIISNRFHPAAEVCEQSLLTKEDIINMVDRLSSVLLIDSDGKIVPMHATFTEFLLDPQRCTDTHYRIDKGAGHAALASACLAAFTWQTTVDILSAVHNGEGGMHVYGYYSAWRCAPHIQAATYSDELVHDLEAALKQGHVLCHLRLLLRRRMDKNRGDTRWDPNLFVRSALYFLKKEQTAAEAKPAETYKHLEAYCKAYLSGMLGTPHKHGSAITEQYIEDQRERQDGISFTPGEILKVQEWQAMCDRVREEIDQDPRARELWYNRSICPADM